jgi:hypothetical protein
MLRCKFRCLELHSRHQSVCAELRPVIAKSDCYPGGSTENAKWFAATPSGKLTLWFNELQHKMRPPAVHDYVYLDIITPADADPGFTYPS